MKAWDEFAEAAFAGKPMPIGVIDIHAHIGPYHVFHVPDEDTDNIVAVMDRCGVAVTAISASEAWCAEAPRGNDRVAEAACRHPGRFAGYAAPNPHYREAVVPELERCFDELGFRMIKIHPSVHRIKLTDPRYEPVFEFAAGRCAPVLTHTWTGDPHCGMDICAETARRHPDVTFLWGHSGGSYHKRAVELALDLPNVYLELATSQVYYGQLEYMVDAIGPERMLFGSDVTFISLPQQIAKVACSDISAEAKRLIFRDNSANILRAAGVQIP